MTKERWRNTIVMFAIITIAAVLMLYCFGCKTSKEYYPDGKLKAERAYKNGKLHGTSRFYNRDGTIWAIQKSKNGIKESMEVGGSENKQ